MMEWLKERLGFGCKHVFPDYLDGVVVVGRFPDPDAVVPFRECLYCRKRVPKQGSDKEQD